VSVGASVGIAMFPNDAGDVDELCRVADMRMYQDKHGSNGYVARAAPSVPDPSSATEPLTV